MILVFVGSFVCAVFLCILHTVTIKCLRYIEVLEFQFQCISLVYCDCVVRFNRPN